jgi:hypothetical protein
MREYGNRLARRLRRGTAPRNTLGLLSWQQRDESLVRTRAPSFGHVHCDRGVNRFGRPPLLQVRADLKNMRIAGRHQAHI